MWVAGISFCLLATLGIVAVARLIPASYANIPEEDARAEDPQTHVALSLVRVNRSNQAQCPECGVIESMRQIERSSDRGRERAGDVKVARGVPGAPSGGPIIANAVTGKSYEFTVRFRNGSTTAFTEASPRDWRLGSRVKVIGPSNTLNK
jgi:hypothetical protein